MQTLFFGTGNAHKLAEIQGILGDGFLIKSFKDLPEKPEVEETEETLEGNAMLKARAFFQITKLPCFADDTGLEVEALNGAPGVYSARYAGPEGDAGANMSKLLKALEGETNRKARFRTVVAFFDGKEMLTFEGILEGEILQAAQGSGGFGYDPVFRPLDAERSLGEFSPEEKNKISHRGRAVRKFVAYLKGE